MLSAAQALVEVGRAGECGPKPSAGAGNFAEICSTRPDIVRAAEFLPGWFIGLSLSNLDKLAIIRTACTVLGIRIPESL